MSRVEKEIAIEIKEERKPRFQSLIRNNAKSSVKAVGSVYDDFKKFINKGNVVDLAVGLVMGAAFTNIVNSMVTDIFTPFIGLAVGSTFENSFIVLRCPPLQQDCRKNLTSLAIAKTSGAVTWNWGPFVQAVLNFLIISLIVYFLVKIYTAAFREEKTVTTKECEYCCKEIPISAKKCAYCCSQVSTDDQTLTQ